MIPRAFSHHKRPLAAGVLRCAEQRRQPHLLHKSVILGTTSFSILSCPKYQPLPKQHFNDLRIIRMSSSNAHLGRDKLFDLKGRVALVTGGGSGIGLMATQALVANGAKVYITGRTQEKLDRVVEQYSEGKDSIIPLTCDVGKKDDIANLVKEISS